MGDGAVGERYRMEFYDYEMDDKEYDRILEESEPCEECGETDTLALAVITTGDHFGTLLIFCTDCENQEKDEFSLERHEKLIYA